MAEIQTHNRYINNKWYSTGTNKVLFAEMREQPNVPGGTGKALSR